MLLQERKCLEKKYDCLTQMVIEGILIVPTIGAPADPCEISGLVMVDIRYLDLGYAALSKETTIDSPRITITMTIIKVALSFSVDIGISIGNHYKCNTISISRQGLVVWR